MVRRDYFISLAILIAAVVAPAARAQEQQIAQLGECPLESGRRLLDCRLGYRTFGRLARDKGNVIISPTAAYGVSAMSVNTVGPGKLLDSSKYFVIVMDSLSNSVSSSPSNSKQQARMQFPHITIKDMVDVEHTFLVTKLHIDHVKAVIGVSMGGMQTFEWMVSYPDFMDKAIPIVGSPRLAPYDLLLWQTEIDATKRDPAWKGGDYDSDPSASLAAKVSRLTLSTPADVNDKYSRESVLEFPSIPKLPPGFTFPDANDRIRQLEAMMSLDVSRDFGGSMEKAAANVKASVLVIVSKQDHTVTPQPALDFAAALHAETLVLDAACGHGAPFCEADLVSQRVKQFFEH
jgi:homoserine O-acetyltransferase/O-succinyltransferase